MTDGKQLTAITTIMPSDRRLREQIRRVPEVSEQAGGDAAGAAHRARCVSRCVSPEAIEEIAELLELHPAEVYDTMTFYGFFREPEKPLGKRPGVGLPQHFVHAPRRRRAAGRLEREAGA